MTGHGHVSDVDLFELACDGRSHDHVTICRECRRGLAAHAAVVKLIRRPAAVVDDMATRSQKAERRAKELVNEARADLSRLPVSLDEIEAEADPDLVRYFVPRHAARLAAESPSKAHELADYLDAAGVAAKTAEGLATRAEAALLRSQAFLFAREYGQAVEATRAARRLFDRLLDASPIDSTRCDYFEGCALSFVGELERSEALLRAALDESEALGIVYWIGRARAALASTLVAIGSKHEEAGELLGSAIAALDPVEDAAAWVGATIARAHLFLDRRLFHEARKGFASALEVAIRERIPSGTIAARIGIGASYLAEGEYRRAESAFVRLLQLEELTTEAACRVRLCLAECRGAMGDSQGMRDQLEAIRHEMPHETRLFARLTDGDVEPRELPRVRLELAADGLSDAVRVQGVERRRRRGIVAAE